MKDGKEYYPSKLLTKSSAKTIKGEKLGWDTYILYLTPHKQNALGKNLCPHASEGCAAACLYTAGRGKFTNVQKARMNKTSLFLKRKSWFLDKIDLEIAYISVKDRKSNGNKNCIRLNGTSDIPWENLKIRDNENIFDLYPHLQFYDYTKSINRLFKNKNKNYHLTFSRSENNDKDCLKALENGYNVAVVFSREWYKNNLEGNRKSTYTIEGKSFKVIDGDVSDLRFLDQSGVIVGLKAKGDASKDTSGFVIDKKLKLKLN